MTINREWDPRTPWFVLLWGVRWHYLLVPGSKTLINCSVIISITPFPSRHCWEQWFPNIIGHQNHYRLVKIQIPGPIVSNSVGLGEANELASLVSSQVMLTLLVCGGPFENDWPKIPSHLGAMSLFCFVFLPRVESMWMS